MSFLPVAHGIRGTFYGLPIAAYQGEPVSALRVGAVYAVAVKIFEVWQTSAHSSSEAVVMIDSWTVAHAVALFTVSKLFDYSFEKLAKLVLTVMLVDAVISLICTEMVFAYGLEKHFLP